jgi:aminoglycoside 6-adenylyltransferase
MDTTLEAKIIAWARAQEAVRAAIVIGSYARLDHPADEWSDLDLILFIDNPSPYVSNPTWLEAFGEIWLAVCERTGRGDPEWDVVYAGGDKLDWVLVDVAGSSATDLHGWLETSPYRFVLERGVRILVDKSRSGPADPAAVVFPFPARLEAPPIS